MESNIDENFKENKERLWKRVNGARFKGDSEVDYRDNGGRDNGEGTWRGYSEQPLDEDEMRRTVVG